MTIRVLYNMKKSFRMAPRVQDKVDIPVFSPAERMFLCNLKIAGESYSSICIKCSEKNGKSYPHQAGSGQDGNQLLSFLHFLIYIKTFFLFFFSQKVSTRGYLSLIFLNSSSNASAASMFCFYAKVFAWLSIKALSHIVCL